ncbi:MAG: HAMP domain-containing protein [Alphaproteobacteria bacterium]|nr:HAMP domain-containing protein [Alphaproteobacteria bacterium]
MSWLSPSTLRGWLVIIVLAALAISQAISYAVLTSQQTILRMTLHEAEAFRRTAGIVKLAHNASLTKLATIATIASGPAYQVRLSTLPAVDAEMADGDLSRALADTLGSDVKTARVAWTPMRVNRKDRVVSVREVRLPHVTFVRPVPPVPPTPPAPPAIAPSPPAPAPHIAHSGEAEAAPAPDAPGMHWNGSDAKDVEDSDTDVEIPDPPEPPDPPDADDIREEVLDPFIVEVSSQPRRLDMAILLKSGMWLNVATSPPAEAAFTWPLILAGGSAAILVALAAIWAAGRLARPIAGLAGAAERFGRGDDMAIAPEEGPTDIKRAATAFNTMAQRLRKTLADQRTLLSAIGHDLRTPISSLRIRTEMVKDPELQQKMTATLDDMQRLTEAALAAARGGDTGEPSQALDLPSLVQSVCDDLADTGQPVSQGTLEPANVQGRASEIKRALRNLIENAVRYGEKAEVSVHAAAPWAEIYVDDEGPGIPPDAIGRVFDPFVRLEESRSTDTGGNGLGLTIARAIALRHGGELTLGNRARGGLRATLKLPLI